MEASLCVPLAVVLPFIMFASAATDPDPQHREVVLRVGGLFFLILVITTIFNAMGGFALIGERNSLVPKFNATGLVALAAVQIAELVAVATWGPLDGTRAEVLVCFGLIACKLFVATVAAATAWTLSVDPSRDIYGTIPPPPSMSVPPPPLPLPAAPSEAGLAVAAENRNTPGLAGRGQSVRGWEAAAGAFTIAQGVFYVLALPFAPLLLLWLWPFSARWGGELLMPFSALGWPLMIVLVGAHIIAGRSLLGSRRLVPPIATALSLAVVALMDFSYPFANLANPWADGARGAFLVAATGLPLGLACVAGAWSVYQLRGTDEGPAVGSPPIPPNAVHFP